ncbi:hypothetical protein VTO73DRAFT_12436 [Trametes versicolor]
MRLLHTPTGAFHWFDDPEDVAYAVVSYVWNQDEQSYQDILNIQSSPSTANQKSTFLSDPRLSSTIRHACKIAANAGHHGTDTLVPASASPTCPTSPPPTPRAEPLPIPRQHLVHGPPNLVFLARDWTVLGTKTTLALALADTSGVDRAVLRGDARAQDVSVARRMCWASRRQGDAAYALPLAGLFGVRVDVGWGEGPRAFVRLQEEIARASNDQSIFAWHYHRGHAHPDGLFAFSPCYFARSGCVSPITSDILAARLGLVGELNDCLPRAAFSSALTMRLPLIPHHIETYSPTTALYEVFGVSARFEHVAALRCADERGQLVVLTLDRPPGAHTGGRNAHMVKVAETPLGQHDRVWSCPKSLVPYRDVVVVTDVEILRKPLETPWIQPVSSNVGLELSVVSRSCTLQGSVILDPASRAALEEQ